MRIAFVALASVGLAGAVPGGVAGAAVLIDPLAGDVAAAGIGLASVGCQLDLAARRANPACLAAPVAQPEMSRKTDNAPPAAVAGIVGLFALAMAFRPRQPARKIGLPEVAS